MSFPTSKQQTFASHEKFPFFTEMAGNPGSRDGLGIRILSSAKSKSSRRFKDTFALTTFKREVTSGLEEKLKNNNNVRKKSSHLF